MKQHLIKKLEILRKKERKKYHPLAHKIHKEHRISKKTLFYVKEYGPHSNVFSTIIKESIRVLLIASVLSSLGGLALERIKMLFLSLVPLVILLPALNDMLGDYGTIISSRFSTMLHEGKVKGSPWKNEEMRKLFVQIFIIALLLAIISAAIAIGISKVSGYSMSMIDCMKIFAITVTDVMVFVCVLFIVSVVAGLHFFRKGEDPDNFLIPITTSIADLGNMFILLFLILLLF